MPERENTVAAPERARVIALSRLAARHRVVCGGTDAAATLEALRGWLEATRTGGDTEQASKVEADLEAILTSGSR